MNDRGSAAIIPTPREPLPVETVGAFYSRPQFTTGAINPLAGGYGAGPNPCYRCRDRLNYSRRRNRNLEKTWLG